MVLDWDRGCLFGSSSEKEGKEMSICRRSKSSIRKRYK